MKFIHRFDTVDDFERDYNGTGYTEPWVSYTEEQGRVNYNKANWARIDLNVWEQNPPGNAIVEYGDSFDNSENSVYYVKYAGSSVEVEYEGGPGYILYGSGEFSNVTTGPCDSAVFYGDGEWVLFPMIC